MSVIRKWSGNDVAAGAMTAASFGPGDTAFTTVSAGIDIVNTMTSRTSSVQWPSAAGTTQVRWSGLGNLNTIAVREYFSFTTVPTVTWYIMGARDSAGADTWQIMISSSSKLRFRDSSTGLNYESPALIFIENQLYRVEVVSNAANGVATANLYAGESTAPIASVAGVVPNMLVDEVRFGQMITIAITGLAADDFAIANTDAFIGPSDVPRTHLRYDGSTWIPQDVDIL